MKTCTIEGCTLPLNCRGRCRKHYIAAWRSGEFGKPKRVCPCGTVCAYGHFCTRCESRAYTRKTVEQRRTRRKLYETANREKLCAYRLSHARARRGFTPEMIDALVQLQKGACALCTVKLTSKGPQRLVCDHDHVSGRARGLLCDTCNTSLGRYEKYQKPAGLRLPPYDAYIEQPPAATVGGKH